MSLKMMRGGGRGFMNETSSSYGMTGSFPHYKQITMPADQRAKLLAMHRASRANAAIYVAVVLAVYLILLTMLLCRYSKRPRPSEGSSGGGTPPRPVFSPSIHRRKRCPKGHSWSFCCPIRGVRGRVTRDDPIHEIIEMPMAPMNYIVQRPSSNPSSTSPIIPV